MLLRHEVIMNSFNDFLLRMGGMHDSIVERLMWSPDEKRIELQFDDLYRNFNGLPEYPGRQLGVIVLHGVSNLSLTLDSDGPLRVFEFLPEEGESDVVVLTFSPTGKLRVQYSAVDHPACLINAVGRT